MAQRAVGAEPATAGGSYRGTRWALRAGFGLQALLAMTQPVLAGSYLSGNLDAISVHSAIGGTLPVVGFLALALAVLHWRPGGGPGWPALVMTALAVLFVVQANAGYSRTLGLHIPLGVTLVGSSVALFAWSVAGRRRSRTAAPPTGNQAVPPAPARPGAER